MGKITGPYPASNWARAKKNCEALGQKLMTIDSQEEDDYVNQILRPTFTRLQLPFRVFFEMHKNGNLCTT